MAVDPDQVDALAAMLADIYREAETALIATITRHLDEGLDSPAAERRLTAVRALRRSTQAIIASLEADTGTVTRDALAAAYRHGWTNALVDIPARFYPSSGIAEDAAAAAEDVIGAGAVEALASALVEDLGDVTRNILRNTVDVFQRVQAGAAARVLTGTQTRRQASQAIWAGLVRRGITGFTDRAGRRWKLSTYAEMAARTNAQRAAVQGQVDRLTTAGIELVYVSDAPQECVLCRPWEGRILRTTPGPLDVRTMHATRDVEVTVEAAATLDQARAQGFQHPNCRHSVSAYLPGVTRVPTNTADPQGSAARERQRELERRIRAAKEQAVGALTPEAERKANARVRDAQAALRAHLAAHPELKRLRYREQIGAGNIPPADARGDGAAPLGPPDEPTLDGGPAPAPEQRTRRRTDDAPALDDVGPGPDQPELEAPPPPRPRAPRELSDAELEAALEAALVDPDRADEIAALGDELDRRDAARRAEEAEAALRAMSDDELEQRMAAAVAEDPDEFNRLAVELDRRENAARVDEPAPPPVPPEIPAAEDLRRLPDDALQALLDAHQAATSDQGVGDLLADLLADPADDPTQRVYAEIEWRDEQRRAAPDPAELDDDALGAALAAAMAPDADPHAVTPIAAESDRRAAIRREREAEAERRAEEKRARARQRREDEEQDKADRVLRLIEDEGWDELEAVAEVYGTSVEQQRRNRAIADLREQGYSGRGFDGLARRAYFDFVERQYFAAEAATNGYMVTNEGRARGIDPRDLFTGPEARARKWASKELRDWWDQHGRTTLDEFKAALLDDPTAIRRLRNESGGDFLA